MVSFHCYRQWFLLANKKPPKEESTRERAVNCFATTGDCEATNWNGKELTKNSVKFPAVSLVPADDYEYRRQKHISGVYDGIQMVNETILYCLKESNADYQVISRQLIRLSPAVPEAYESWCKKLTPEDDNSRPSPVYYGMEKSITHS
ncbi:uncharacterized protein [Watersipora subatra]|uniref:uncharacterized protein n=1 Tax=Watersipora subatra TaxID=2589382 RepID=UPI00355C6A3B